MYPKTSAPQTEETPFAPRGSKARTRALMAAMLLQAMAHGRVEALIARAPEFYGPGKTQGVSNSLVFDPIARDEKPRVPLRADTLRSLIWTPDASRAMALLGNTPDAYGQTWHLPIDSDRRTYAQLIDVAAHVWGRSIEYRVLRWSALAVARRFSSQVRERWELLPRYAVDNIFVFDKFTTRFPDFEVPTYERGIELLKAQHTSPSSS